MIEKFILKKKKIKSKSKIKPILTTEFMSNIKRPLNGVLNNGKFIKKTNYKIYNWKKYLVEELESTI
jgi:dTDP-4-dehydrorhamnose reductase